MHRMDTTSFSCRRARTGPPEIPSLGGPADRPGGAPPARCYDTDNPWNNMAGHLIWLGASEIAALRARPGVDPNQVLATIAAINQAGGTYEDREASTAHELEASFDFIRLKDGTSAGVERTRFN